MNNAVKRGLIIGVILVLIAFLPGAGDFLISLLVPPTVYIIIGLLILAALMVIIHQNNQRGSGNE